MQGVQEEVHKETRRRMGREMRRRGFGPSPSSSPLLQPYRMNRAVCIPHAAPLSLSLVTPYCPLYHYYLLYYMYYITCIIKTQYYSFFSTYYST
jgi:hypothetical protein